MSATSITTSFQRIYIATLGPGRITRKGVPFFPLENDYISYKIAYRSKYQNPDFLEGGQRVRASKLKNKILNPIKIYKWLVTLLKEEYVSNGGEVIFDQLIVMESLRDDLIESIVENLKGEIFDNCLEAVRIIDLISSHSQKIKYDEKIIEFCMSVKSIERLKNIERQRKYIKDIQRME